MSVIKKEIEELKDIHNQVEQLLVTLTSSLQIILSGAGFKDDTKEKVRTKILKDTVNISERLMDVINRLESLDSQ
jgi:cytochrome c556